MNKAQIAAVFLIVSVILINANASIISPMFFIIALVYFVYFAVKGE